MKIQPVQGTSAPLLPTLCPQKLVKHATGWNSTGRKTGPQIVTVLTLSALRMPRQQRRTFYDPQHWQCHGMHVQWAQWASGQGTCSGLMKPGASSHLDAIRACAWPPCKSPGAACQLMNIPGFDSHCPVRPVAEIGKLATWACKTGWPVNDTVDNYAEVN